MNKKSIPCLKFSNKNIDLLFVVTLSLNVVVAAVNHIVNLFAPGTPVDTILCYILYSVFVLMAIPSIVKRLSIYVPILLATGLLFFSIALFRTETSHYASNYIWIFFLQMIPLFILGNTIDNLDSIDMMIEKILPWIAIMCMVYFFSELIRGAALRKDDMTFSYSVLPFTVYSIISILKEPISFRNILIFIVLLTCQILTGTRGPLVCLLSAVILYFLFSKRSFAFQIAMIILGAVFAAYLMSDMFMHNISEIITKLSSFGIDNRILIKLQYGNFLEGSGREEVSKLLWSKIMEQPFFGYGFLGDRNLILGRAYPHNLFLEVLCQFGFLFGGIVLASFLLFVAKLLKNNRNSTLIIMLVSCSIVKLMISGTYVTEALFFVLLGVMLNKHVKLKRCY